MADTPIYDGVERRLRAGDQRFKQLEARIDASDEQVAARDELGGGAQHAGTLVGGGHCC